MKEAEPHEGMSGASSIKHATVDAEMQLISLRG